MFEINGFRFFSAAWMAIWATLKIFVDSKRRYLYLLALTPLVHITFLFYLFMIAISYIAIRSVNEKLLLYLFVASIFIGLVWDTLPNIVDMGDGVFGDLLKSYLNDDYKSEIDTAVRESNFIKFFTPLRFLYYNITTLMLYISCKDIERKKFVLLVLVLLSITNCVGFIPSMSRFLNVIIPFILIILNHSISCAKNLKVLVYFLPVVELFRLYQIYFTLYPDVLPDGFLLNIFLT